MAKKKKLSPFMNKVYTEYLRLKPMANDIEKALGLKAYGFGPGISFYVLPRPNQPTILDSTFTISEEMAQRMFEYINGRNIQTVELPFKNEVKDVHN